ncbi:MAG: tRNA (adenosine(37)-N6)-dimethylallyltransferase MiaA [Dehalococcoidia bacterium]
MPLTTTRLITIVGPTAAGKTRLAIALAQELRGEIINADSRQVYRYLDIGTAKPTPEERSQAPHHLLDLRDPDQNFDLGTFLTLAKATIADIRSRDRLPIIAGGTGQYIWALLEGWQVPEVPPDLEFRRSKEAEADRLGSDALFQELQSLDPVRAAELDPQNLRRVIRALEILHTTGVPPSEFNKRAEPQDLGPIIGLGMNRDRLYQRIDQRVDLMMEQGFLEECRDLSSWGYRLGEGPLACPGYRELGQYLSGQLTLAESVQRTKYQTHRLARRQYTWFKLDDPRIHWLNAGAPTLVDRSIRFARRFSV